MGRQVSEAQKLACRRHYLLWLLEQFQDDPDADLGEMTMSAYADAWHKRKTPANERELAEAEHELRKLAAHFVRRAEQRI